jgi:hypothetical protein
VGESFLCLISINSPSLFARKGIIRRSTAFDGTGAVDELKLLMEPKLLMKLKAIDETQSAETLITA